MPARNAVPTGPTGGLHVSRRLVRRWRWTRSADVATSLMHSAPVRCKGDASYIIRAHGGATGFDALLHFEHDADCIARRVVRLRPGPHGALLGWFTTPAGCNTLSVRLARHAATQVERLDLHPLADRDPVSHPLANVPRWNSDSKMPALRRVVLPESLAGLAVGVDWCPVEIAPAPTARAALASLVRGSAVVVDANWARDLALTWRDLDALARDGWVIVDLETAARLRRGECKVWSDPHDIMSARVAYADVATRGFALQDVAPFSFIDARGRFATRVIRATREWNDAARKAELAAILTSETPWSSRCGDILSLQRRAGQGALLATDLPWLNGGLMGPLLAPRLAAALLRAHLGGPVADHLQQWNRAEDVPIIVRDLADLVRRYPPLRTARWQSDDEGMLRLGIALVDERTPAARSLVLSTGRIDAMGLHDGLPSEPMAIFMKWLAREAREQTDWACRHLRGRSIVWQFDAAQGHKYAVEFDSAVGLCEGPTTTARVCFAPGGAPVRSTDVAIVLPSDEGILGDGSLALQDELTRRLCRLIEQT